MCVCVLMVPLKNDPKNQSLTTFKTLQIPFKNTIDLVSTQADILYNML